MPHNTREGIEEAVDDYLAITKVHPSIDKRKQLIGAFHQELQKAREEERERCIKVVNDYGKSVSHLHCFSPLTLLATTVYQSCFWKTD